MENRSNKYDSVNQGRMSRLEKNKDLYKRISEKDIDNFDIYNNATVLETNSTSQIDIEQIKKILDTKYNQTEKRKSIKIEEEKPYELKEEDTREYDLNIIIDKAKSEQEIDYEIEKAKKAPESSYDILKNLNIDKKVDNEIVVEEIEISKETEENKDILNLINTIVINEQKIKDENTEIALDLFEDLKEDKNEEVKESIDKKEDKNIEEKEIDLDSEFMTKETKFKKSDFESLEDEKESNWLLIIFIILIIIGFGIGLYIFLKNYIGI